MFPNWAYGVEKVQNTTTSSSSSILIDGRPPRRDRRDKITEISRMLITQSSSYPLFTSKMISGIVKVVLGPVDPRTIQSYTDWVINYSAKDNRLGMYDVSDFCERILEDVN